MAKKPKPTAPAKKYTPDEVIERFRAKDDPELGRYATYAASHRAKLAKVSEKEKARQEKELKKQEAQKKQFEKAVTPEQLYQETAEAAVYDAEDDDGDMPSSDIKGKIFSNYQPLSSAPAPGKEAPKSVSAQISATVSAPKPSVRDLTRLFNQKFAEQKKEEEKEKQTTGKKQKTETKKVTKKLIRKARPPIAGRTPQVPDQRPKSAPPLPPAKKVDAKYVKQQHEELKKQQDKEEKAAEKAEKADAKKEAETASAADPQSPTTDRHRSPFKTGFWIMCGVFAFLIILVLLFFVAVAAISYLSGVPLVENVNGSVTLVLP